MVYDVLILQEIASKEKLDRHNNICNIMIKQTTVIMCSYCLYYVRKYLPFVIDIMLRVIAN